MNEREDDQPQRLSQRVAEQVSLQARGDVHVVVLLAKVKVVVDVVLFVCDGQGDGDGQVAPDAQHPVHPSTAVAEGQVVANLVDGAAQ